MSKPEFKTFEEAEKAYNAKKKEVRTAYDEIKAFEKTNKLGFGKVSPDKKVAAEHLKLKAAHKALKATLEGIETSMKALKPPSEKGSFTKKYDYPTGPKGEELTSDEKKSFRRKARSNAKAGKGLPTYADAKGTGAVKKEDKKEEPKADAKKVDKKAPVAETTKKKPLKVASKKKVEEEEEEEND